MRKILFRTSFALLFMLVGNGISCAQTQRLVVWQKNGEKVYYDLEERPKTTFGEGCIVITTTSMSITYPLEQVLRYTYELQSTGVESTENAKPIRVSQQGNDLVIENLRQGTPVQIFSTDGKLLATQTVADERPLTISLATYPSGVYIVKANDVTYKMMKR